MSNNSSNVKTILQGQYEISADPGLVMHTLLGSCIAACLCDPVAGVGGMNHFLLPGKADDQDRSLRYGINSMELLINGLLRAGASRGRLQAKLFGGAKMLSNLKNIGESNSDFARWFLEMEGIKCVNSSVGGTRGRKIRFWPHTGQAQQMFMEGAVETVPPAPVAAPKPPTDIGDVDLF